MTAANATKTARARKAVRAAARLTAPPGDRWAAVFGRIAVYSFIVALISGVLLLPFFRPSMATVAYHGSYSKLDGAPMSQAYRSVLDISFDVRAGLLTRQVHHWSADLFVAAICLRLLRAFFRGRFSGRALPDWLIWVALLPLGMLAAYTGTILPDDGLSGGSLAVVTGLLPPRQPTWRTAPRPAWPASRSTACCGPRQPTTRSPTTCRSLSIRSPGSSGARAGRAGAGVPAHPGHLPRAGRPATRRGTARPGNRADREEPARRLSRNPRASPPGGAA